MISTTRFHLVSDSYTGSLGSATDWHALEVFRSVSCSWYCRNVPEALIGKRSANLRIIRHCASHPTFSASRRSEFRRNRRCHQAFSRRLEAPCSYHHAVLHTDRRLLNRIQTPASLLLLGKTTMNPLPPWVFRPTLRFPTRSRRFRRLVPAAAGALNVSQAIHRLRPGSSRRHDSESAILRR